MYGFVSITTKLITGDNQAGSSLEFPKIQLPEFA